MILVTKSEVASVMKVCERTVDRWVALQLIPFYKVGNKRGRGSGAVRFNIDEILQHTKINPMDPNDQCPGPIV